jgi:Thiol-activated cytolysin
VKKLNNGTDPPTQSVQNSQTVTCTTTHYTLAANPDKIVIYEPDVNVLWPGALIQGHGLLSVGSLGELPIRARAPLHVSVNLLTSPNSATVDHPSQESVEAAIGSLIDPLAGKKIDFGSSIAFSMKETYSAEQAALSLGITAKYSGFDFTAKHSEVTTEKQSVITASFIQKCFTVSAENPETPADLFSPEFSLANLMEQGISGASAFITSPSCYLASHTVAWST